MYNLNGLVYTSRILFIIAGIFILGTLAFFFFEKKKITLKKEKEANKRKVEKLRKKEKRIKIEVISALCLPLCLISFAGFYAYKSHNPTIAYQDLYYLYRSSYRGDIDYIFTVNKNSKKLSFKMPNKEEIYPDNFSKENSYRVYYEKSTKYIVRIEEIDK